MLSSKSKDFERGLVSNEAGQANEEDSQTELETIYEKNIQASHHLFGSFWKIVSRESLLKLFLSGSGFMADSYNLFTIDVAVDIMKKDYPITPFQESFVKAAALFGAMVGQFTFGYIADLIGRKPSFLITCALIIVGALVSATLYGTNKGDVDDDNGGSSSGDGSTIFIWLGMVRFLLGVGVGGEYPLSATITSESTFPTNTERIKSLCSVFSMQGFGRVLSGLVLILTTQTFSSYEAMWRFSLAFGAVPMLISMYPRWKKMSESALFVEQEARRREEEGTHGDESLSSRAESPMKTIRDNWSTLLGTAGGWFLLDIVFYGNGLFSGAVTKAMGLSDTVEEEAIQSFLLQLIALPGYICSILYMSSIGCKKLQMYGFGLLTLIFLAMSLLEGYLADLGYIYLFIYGMTFFVENFGPNATVYVIPSFVFPTKGRSTLHGLSAAFGKVGAVVGTFTLLYVKQSFCGMEACADDDEKNIERGIELTFGVCSAVSLAGLAWTYVYVKDEVHEDLLRADAQVRERLEGDEAIEGVELGDKALLLQEFDEDDSFVAH